MLLQIDSVEHAGVLLADPDTQPRWEQSILIEGERIKAVSDGFIDLPPGGELIDLRKKFVLPGLIDCHVHLTPRTSEASISRAHPALPQPESCRSLSAASAQTPKPSGGHSIASGAGHRKSSAFLG